MERSQFDLCIEVLRRLDRAGILRHIIVVGSWCTLFYRSYFKGTKYAPVLKTRDIDFLVAQPSAIRVKTDVAELLKDLGFVIGFTGSQGYIRLEHPQLIVEFLVPERGRASDKPHPLPQLGVNAQALRFLDLLGSNTITVKVKSLSVTLPHPADFAVHKLLVLHRRTRPDKSQKDRDGAIQIIEALFRKGQRDSIITQFRLLPTRWRTRVRAALEGVDNKDLTSMFAQGGARIRTGE